MRDLPIKRRKIKDDQSEHFLLIDWQREAKEEEMTLRFCPNCGELVQLKLKEHKYYPNFYMCPKCEETVLSRGMIRNPFRGTQ